MPTEFFCKLFGTHKYQTHLKYAVEFSFVQLISHIILLNFTISYSYLFLSDSVIIKFMIIFQNYFTKKLKNNNTQINFAGCIKVTNGLHFHSGKSLLISESFLTFKIQYISCQFANLFLTKQNYILEKHSLIN